MGKQIQKLRMLAMGMMVFCSAVSAQAKGPDVSSACEDEATTAIYKILAADKDKVVNQMFELTNLKLAVYLSGKSKTVEDFVRTKITNLKETVSKSDVPAQVKAVYEAHNSGKADKVKEDLDAFVKRGQDACYYSPSLRLRNDDVASFVNALRLQGESFTEEDVAIYWMAEKLRKSHAATDKTYGLGKENGNHSNASNMIALYLGGVDEAQKLSTQQMTEKIQTSEKALMDAFTQAASTESIRQNYLTCMQAAGETCSATDFESRFGSLNAKDVIKKLSASVNIEQTNFDEQKISEKIGAKACAKITGKAAPVTPVVQANANSAGALVKTNLVTPGVKNTERKPSNLTPVVRQQNFKNGDIDAYFPMNEWEKRTPTAPNNRRAYGVDPRVMGDIKPQETLADFFKKHATDDELGASYEQFGACHVSRFNDKYTITKGYDMTQLTGLNADTESKAKAFCTVKKGTHPGATQASAVATVKSLVSSINDIELSKKHDPSRIAGLNFGACKIRMYNQWNDKSNTTNDPTNRAFEISRSGTPVLKGNLDLGCAFYENCDKTHRQPAEDYDGLVNYMLAACK